MKKLISTTETLKSKLDTLKLERKPTTSITDKAMSGISIDVINVGDLESITMFEVVDDTTGEVNKQVMLSTSSGAYTTCSQVVYGLMDELMDMIADGSVSIEEVGLTFNYGTTRQGNKYLACSLI